MIIKAFLYTLAVITKENMLLHVRVLALCPIQDIFICFSVHANSRIRIPQNGILRTSDLFV